MKILLIDDNESSLYFLQALLNGNGYETVTARNGREALDLLRKEPCQLVITDVLMPVMDGFTLCREIRADAGLQHIPYIVYTATYTGPQDEQLALDLGADLFVIKPQEPEVLLSLVKEYTQTEKAVHKMNKEQEKSEEEVLKLYNERLVRKLEQKMFQAESEVKAHLITLNALNRSEALLKATQSITKIGGWELNLDNDELYWTDETYHIHDLDPEEADKSGTHLMEVFLGCLQEKDRTMIYSAYQRCRDTGEPFEYCLQFTSLQGRRLYIQAAGQAARQEGRIVKVYGYIQDVTERVNNEKLQNELREQLRQSQKMESIGQLAGGVAHDFNNILTVILGYGEEILSSLKQEDPIYKDMDEIVKAGYRALSLTKKLLAFSRKQVIKPEVVNLNKIVSEINNMLMRLIGSGIEYQTSLASEPANIKVDPGQLEQLIMNIVINARDAMPKGGKLTISTANHTLTATQRIGLYDAPAGEYVRLSFEDTGIGMDETTLERIFEPFFTTKGEMMGTGLGLSTVYGMVRQAGGFIWAVSEPGKGSAFHVLYPVTREKAKPVRKELGDSDLHGTGELVLLVEDDINLRRMMKNMIQNLGYQVTAAVSGEEALMFVRQGELKPDIVVTDVVMLGLSGPELADKLKVLLPEAGFLFISGYVDHTILREAIVDKGLPFLQKPFSSNDLGREIKLLLQPGKNHTTPKASILMLDDDANLLLLYERIVTRAGHRFSGFATAEAAEAALLKDNYDVLLIDMKLEHTNGIEVLKQFRQKGFGQPAILFTSVMDVVEQEALSELTKVQVLEKSSDNILLLRAIRELLAQTSTEKAGV